jgi:hypothetical protein
MSMCVRPDRANGNLYRGETTDLSEDRGAQSKEFYGIFQHLGFVHHSSVP